MLSTPAATAGRIAIFLPTTRFLEAARVSSGIEVNRNAWNPTVDISAHALHYLRHENLFPGRSAAEWVFDDCRIDGPKPFPGAHANSNVPLMRRLSFAKLWWLGYVDDKEKPAPALFGDSEDGGVPEWSKAVDSEGSHSRGAGAGKEERNLSNGSLTFPARSNAAPERAVRPLRESSLVSCLAPFSN
ncbi:hypothetical protein [Bradyrhizobium genosp. P]|uniref:hypothetical protein n=1 Tax=Bradyrhizobium genosp. P TaxID=83641 RepID=UPI003CF5AA8B